MFDSGEINCIEIFINQFMIKQKFVKVETNKQTKKFSQLAEVLINSHFKKKK